HVGVGPRLGRSGFAGTDGSGFALAAARLVGFWWITQLRVPSTWSPALLSFWCRPLSEGGNLLFRAFHYEGLVTGGSRSSPPRLSAVSRSGPCWCYNLARERTTRPVENAGRGDSLRKCSLS